MTKCLVGLLAVMFLSFSKKRQSDGQKSDPRHLVAFFLASCLMASFLYGLGLLGSLLKPHLPVRVVIQSNVDVHDVVAAIQSTHRNDLEIKKLKNPSSNWMEMIFGGALGLMLLTGLMLFLYKQVCRWMHIPPEI